MSAAGDADAVDVVVAERGELRAEGRDVAADPAVDVARWCELAVATLADEGLARGQVDLHFVDVAEITALNEAHLDGTGHTDVVSFPYEDDPRAATAMAAAGGAPPILGDVVICTAVAAQQAPDHAGTTEDELALLVVHGVLHVLGWDHAGDAEATAMHQREAEVLARAGFGFPHPARR